MVILPRIRCAVAGSLFIAVLWSCGSAEPQPSVIDLTATATSSSQVQLNWKAPTPAAAYVVFRKEGEACMKKSPRWLKRHLPTPA